MAAKPCAKADIPKHILDAIQRVWPDGIVQIDSDLIDDSYFHDLHSKLHRSLSRIKGASLRYERGAKEQRPWEEDWDSRWSDNPPIDDNTYSYHLFCICPDHKLFRYEPETEEPDEEDPEAEESIAGQGFIGCVVGGALPSSTPFRSIHPFKTHRAAQRLTRTRRIGNAPVNLFAHPGSVPSEHCRYGPNVFSTLIEGCDSKVCSGQLLPWIQVPQAAT